MNQEAAAIARQIDRLDHPDAGIQDSILDEFSKQPAKIRPIVLANFPLVNARIRRALLRWLDGVLTAEVRLPLMRYVFDSRGTISEQTGRTMAMRLLLKRARNTQTPEERGQLRAFAEDMCGDDNPEIRRDALIMLASVGDHSSTTYVEVHVDDDDEEIRSAAQRAMKVLNEAPAGADEPQWSSDRLCRELLNSAGARRRQLVRRWRRHDDRTNIAVDVLRNRGDLREEALAILQKEPTPKARPFLAGIVLDDPNSGRAALALRVLATLGSSGHVGPDETQAIRHALRSPEVLSQTAACAAIASFGLDDFATQLVSMTRAHDISIALEAARSLDKILSPSHHELCPSLLDALRANDRRRRHKSKDRDRLHLVAHLLSALSRIVSPSTIGTEAVHRAVFEVLADGHRHRPLRVTGLQQLMKSTPQDGLNQFERWSVEQTTVLLDMLDGADDKAARRIGQLLYRGAPEEMPGLTAGARKLWRSGFVDVAEIVVPLLDRSGSKQALKWLEEIAAGDDKPASTAARKVLRSRRNDQEVIDVEFIPDDD